MPQIINETNWGGNIGEGIGSGFNTGIERALNYLTAKKFHDLTELKHQKGNISALTASGFSNQDAEKIAASNNPQIISAAIKRGPSGNPEAEKSAFAAAYGEPYQNQVAPSALNAMQQELGKSFPIQNKPINPNMQTQQPPQATPQEIKKQAMDVETQNYIKQLANPLLANPAEQPTFGKNAANEELAKEVKADNKPSDYVNIAPIPTAEPPIDPSGLTPAQYKDALKARHEREQENQKEGEEYWKERLKSKEAIPKEEHAINEMLKIRKKGQLPKAKEWKLLTELEENAHRTALSTGSALGTGAAAVAGIIGGPALAAPAAIIGGGIGTVTGYFASLYAGLRKSQLREENPDIAKYEKDVATLVKGLPASFKGTISEAVLTAWMDTVPTLMVDNEGSIKILEDIKSGIDLTKKLNHTADKIYIQNGRKIPRGFQSLVLEQHEKDVEKWIKGLEDSVEYAQEIPTQKA